MESITKEGCGVCLYKTVFSKDEPCVSCKWNGGTEDRFEHLSKETEEEPVAKVKEEASSQDKKPFEKVCGNCKYRSIGVHKEPCCDCYEQSKWEFMDVINNREKICGTCLYELTDSKEEPCSNCAGVTNPTEWKSRFVTMDISPSKSAVKDFLNKRYEDKEALKKVEKLCEDVSSKADSVNHPSHYENSCSLECIEAMEIIFGIETVVKFCTLNAFKYIWRWKHKNGQEDLKKAKWYIDRVCSYYSVATEVVMYNIDQDWQACLRMLRYIEGQELRKED